MEPGANRLVDGVFDAANGVVAGRVTSASDPNLGSDPVGLGTIEILLEESE